MTVRRSALTHNRLLAVSECLEKGRPKTHKQMAGNQSGYVKKMWIAGQHLVSIRNTTGDPNAATAAMLLNQLLTKRR